MTYADCYWTSQDGLKLHYREYAGREDRPPVICLPGLTRNARDFAPLAERLAGDWRVICPDLRGRGDSDYAKDSATYNPMQYVDDISLLLEQAGIARFVAIGTSLGGLMTMILAMTMPERIAAAVLNDIGPDLEPEGFARIKAYVGSGRSFPTWMHAARGVEESQGLAFPDYEMADWLAMAKRLMVLSSNERIVFDYDMKIAEPLLAMPDPQPAGDVADDVAGDEAAGQGLWPGVDGLAGKPVLLVRGELTDLLSTRTLARMQARLPGAETVTVARTGHAPTLLEPEVIPAIERLLARVA